MTPPPSWRDGGLVPVAVVRHGRQVMFDLPVVSWSPSAWWGSVTSEPDDLVGILAALVLTGVGLFTFIKRPSLPSARALMVLCAAIGANAISTSLPDGLSAQMNPWAHLPSLFFNYQIMAVIFAPSLLSFTWLFPRPKRALAGRPWLWPSPYALGVALYLLMTVTKVAIIGWIGTMLMVILSIASLIHAWFNQKDSVSRAQMRWAVGGSAAGMVLLLLVFPPAFGWVTDSVLARVLSAGPSLGFAVVGISLAVAILRYRLYDIDLIVRRTLVYAVISTLLALVYVGCVTLFESLFNTFSGQRSQVSIVISTLFIAALFTPLRRRVQTFVDRRFYRRKYDAAQTLASFARMARDEVDLDQLSVELVKVLQETLQPAAVSVWLKE